MKIHSSYNNNDNDDDIDDDNYDDFFKLHFDILKINILMQTSLMIGNLYSAGPITSISIEKKYNNNIGG